MADELPKYWTDGLNAAIRNDDHTVELVESDNGGVMVEIDGVRMFVGHGYPIESFNVVSDYEQHLTDDGRAKLCEVSG